MSNRPKTISPYAGLRPFSEENADFFFGRDAMREILVAHLLSSRVTLVYGPSGVGKTSLVTAGVAHTLRRMAFDRLDEIGEPGWVVVVHNEWRQDSIERLTQVVREAVRDALDENSADAITVLHDIVDSFRLWSRKIGGKILIILDQFEDLFFNVPSDADGVIRELGRLIKSPDLDVNFLISIRDDAYSKVNLLKREVLEVLDNSIEIKHLDFDSARSAIELPISKYNHFYGAADRRIRIEEELTRAVLNDLRTSELSLTNSESAEPNVSHSDIEAPFLQLVMSELWDAEMLAHSSTLRLKTLAELGGAKQIASSYLKRVLKGLSDRDIDVAARVFRLLVTPSGRRVAHTAFDLACQMKCTEDELRDLLERLAARRIVRPVRLDGGNKDQAYDIVHDLLCPGILWWRRDYDARAEERARSARLTRILIVAVVLLSVFTLLLGFAWKQEADKRKALTAANVTSQILAETFGSTIESYADFLRASDRVEGLLGQYEDDKNQVGIGILLNNKAGLYRWLAESFSADGKFEDARSKYEEALEYNRQAARILKGSLGRGPDLATSLNDTGLIYMRLGKYAEAGPFFAESLAILEEVLGPNDRYLASAVRNLAECNKLQGRYDVAKGQYQRSFEILRHQLGEPALSLADAYYDLARVSFEQGDYNSAIPLFDSAKRLWEESPQILRSQVAPDIALCLEGLAACDREQGRFEDAAQRLDQAQEMLEKNHEGTVALTDNLENLALLRIAQGELIQAEKMLNDMIQNRRNALGPDHPDTARSKCLLGSVYRREGKLAEAERFLNEAREVQKSLPDSLNFARTLAELARLYSAKGDVGKAGELFGAAEAIYRGATPAHPELREITREHSAILENERSAN